MKTGRQLMKVRRPGWAERWGDGGDGGGEGGRRHVCDIRTVCGIGVAPRNISACPRVCVIESSKLFRDTSLET